MPVCMCQIAVRIIHYCRESQPSCLQLHIAHMFQALYNSGYRLCRARRNRSAFSATWKPGPAASSLKGRHA
jgi:hypothetical protein